MPLAETLSLWLSSPPARVPSPVHHSYPALDCATEKETQELDEVADSYVFAMPKTSEQATLFLEGIMGVKLWEADGFSHGETKGDIVGYDMLNGTNYGGSDDPLPRGARAAFGWRRSARPRTTGWRCRRARASVGARDEHAFYGFYQSLLVLPDDRVPNQ